MSVRTYNPSVRVGNWNEDICLEEDLLKDFLDKKEKGELLIQKTHKLLDNILRKYPLTVSRDGFVHFGDSVMLVNPGQESIPESMQKYYCQVAPPRPPTSLSINMDEYKMYLADKVEAPCDVSASLILTPCTRNVFVIKSVDGTEEGSALRFGQPFAISTTPGYGGDLNLFSDHKHFNQNAKKSRQQLIQLVDEINYLTTWQVIPFHPQHRLEYEGLPVPANSKLLLLHNKTGKQVFVQDMYRQRTPFGRDYEVTGHTELDSHKFEKDNNHWVIVSGNPSDDETTQFNRPIPQPSGVPKTEAAALKNPEEADVDPKPATI